MENVTEHNVNELEAMRSQMQLLKQKLDNQEIINDQLIRNAMSKKMSWIHKYIWFELLVGLPLCTLNFVGLKLMNPGLSVWAIASILLLVLVEILLDFYINNMSASDWQSENLLQTADKLVKMKKLRLWQVGLSLPVAIALFVWLFSGFEDKVMYYTVIGGIVGGVIGLTIGIAILIKMQSTNDSLISQIREMKDIQE